MKPHATENIYDFINRVEEARVRLKVRLRECLRNFQPNFPENFKNFLRQTMASQMLMQSMDERVEYYSASPSLTWQKVARLAAEAKPGSVIRGSK